MELNETKLHDLLGKVVTELGAAANEPLITIVSFSKLRRAGEYTF